LNFLNENLGREFPILWEGYSEPITENQKLVFGYTPNYIRVGCVIDREESLENRIIKAELKTISNNYVLTEI
jgi:threonylcarbamoyladenosine tRNA methylthiotransferase MtaB